LLDVVRGALASARAKGSLEHHDARYQSAGAAPQTDHGAGAEHFYNLVTDFYEYGWGQSFHFAPRQRGESLSASIARLEHTVAARLALKPGMRVLDAGCGIGGPMRSIARSHGASIEGATINAYQVERARALNVQHKLDGLCSVVLADFTQLPHESASFDAAYSFEAICHAEQRERVLRELARVVKPGGLVAGTDWCLTSRFDASDPEHQRIRHGIEEGNGIAPMITVAAFEQAVASAGLELLEAEDLALLALREPRELPWYEPLKSNPFTLHGLRRTRVGRQLTTIMVTALERVKLAPSGTRATAEILNRAADALVEGGERGIFTPLVFFVARVPHA
jgi:sterol 24-C-methyltransferase